jgi:hypothetical protein
MMKLKKKKKHKPNMKKKPLKGYFENLEGHVWKLKRRKRIEGNI